MDDLSEQLVDALGTLHGIHPGFRAAHARGLCAAGSFRATPEARALSRAAHLQGEPVPAVVRLSNGSGNPDLPDANRDGRGMAVRLQLPGGESTDLVGVTLPVFFVRTPEDFLGFLAARRVDPSTGAPDQAAVLAWLGEHPETVPAVQLSLAAEPPVSYATCRYFGVHTFVLHDADDRSQPIRYHWEPAAGVATITEEEAAGRAADYLTAEWHERLAGGAPVSFELWFTLADEGDPLDDPTVAWPPERRKVLAGRLDLTDAAVDCDRLIFDPTRVVDGVTCSQDPILHARAGAYGVSYARRTR